MKVDFSSLILDQKGAPITSEDGLPFSLQSLAEQALLSQFSDEQALPAVDKVKRYKLFNKVNSKEWNLSAEEVTLLKLCIGKGFAPLAVGRAFDIIEAAEKS